jgi:catechol 2,3-dioxygenase-like lactoylglutathione lyase family enzyme
MAESEITGEPDVLERQPEAFVAGARLHDVGGVLLPRPFKIRRVGHFGYNCLDIDRMLDFYVDGLGLIISDQSGRMPGRLPPDEQATLSDNDRLLHFTRFGSDHHQLVFISQKVWDWVGQNNGSAGASINQVTWQVGSLAEVVNGSEWIWGQGERLLRSGRDMPGSNWHTYLFDPEGHINELFYGMEQIGWDGLSKPSEMWSGVLDERPSLPQISETGEVQRAAGAGLDLASGHRVDPRPDQHYEVDGISMSRPFKIVGIGPISLFVDDLPRAEAFYTRVLGFTVRERLSSSGYDGLVLHSGAEYFTLALYESGLRGILGLPDRADSMALGFRVANYRHLRSAVEFMCARGAQEVRVPAELVPGFDYVTHLKDPDGNLVQLYYYQRQCGPADPPTPAVSSSAAEWPEVIEAPPDVFGGQQFLGPWE